MEDILDVKKIVSKEQSSQQEQELLGSMVTKVEEGESSDKNAVNLCVTSSIENQVAGPQIETSSKEVKTIEESLCSSIKTDISECASAVSKKNDSSYGENKNTKCRKVLANYKNTDFDKFPSTKENAELISLYGLFIFS